MLVRSLVRICESSFTIVHCCDFISMLVNFFIVVQTFKVRCDFNVIFCVVYKLQMIKNVSIHSQHMCVGFFQCCWYILIYTWHVTYLSDPFGLLNFEFFEVTVTESGDLNDESWIVEFTFFFFYNLYKN